MLADVDIASDLINHRALLFSTFPLGYPGSWLTHLLWLHANIVTRLHHVTLTITYLD
jgi:hypothetical protein